MRDLAMDSDVFPAIGAAFEAQEHAPVRIARVGSATARLLPQRAVVDFTQSWLAAHRTGMPAEHGPD